jgi:hypothetical protein
MFNNDLAKNKFETYIKEKVFVKCTILELCLWAVALDKGYYVAPKQIYNF